LDILFCNSKLEKECCNSKARQKKYGAERANRLGRRLDDLSAAANLAVMRTLPGRCHELTGDLKGQLAIDLDGPYRLIFESADEPPPVDDNGSLDWSGVTSIRILRIGDYHNG
jgi:plasmid maintenance system killer protein